VKVWFEAQNRSGSGKVALTARWECRIIAINKDESGPDERPKGEAIRQKTGGRSLFFRLDKI
jgi:hypothetical protein